MPSHKAGGNWGDVRASELCEQGRRADTEVNFVSLLLSHLRALLFLPLSGPVLSRSPSEFRPYVLDPVHSSVPFSAQLDCLLALSLFGPLGT